MRVRLLPSGFGVSTAFMPLFPGYVFLCGDDDQRLEAFRTKCVLMKGMKVRIRSGPLSGIEGSVIKRRGKDTLLVGVNFVQQGASVALGDYEAEKIE